MKSLSNLKVILVGHSYVYGPLSDLEWYLRPRVKHLVVMRTSLYPAKQKSWIRINYYEKGKKTVSKTIILPTLDLLFKKTFLEYTMRFVTYFVMELEAIGYDQSYDIAIAQDPVSTLIAVMLRKIGKTGSVIFHSHSYIAPKRPVLYRLIDRYATRSSDVVWALSRRLVKIRKVLGAKKVLHAPICIRDDILDKVTARVQRREKSAIYIGTLNRDKGADILMKLIPTLAKVFEKIHIVGKGPYEDVFRIFSTRISTLKFHGPLPLEKSMKLASKSMLGIMLSRPTLELITTDPMKPKVYLAANTPVMLPSYIELAKEVQQYNAGIVIERLSAKYIANKLLGEIDKLESYVGGARTLAKVSSYWRCNKILSTLLRETLLEM